MNADRLAAIEALSAELLSEIETGKAELENLALKAGRLAGLLADAIGARAFRLEVSGYRATGTGLSAEDWEAARWSGRIYMAKNPSTGQMQEYAHVESIGQLEAQVRTAEAALRNPTQVWVMNEKATLAAATGKLGQIKANIHRYAAHAHSVLRFSGISGDVFARLRERVDASIRSKIPEAANKFLSAHEGLRSTNPEDWSGAVHSCRRILQELADTLFPPSDAERTTVVNGKPIQIKLGATQYINRLVCYVEDRSDSEHFGEVVGSHLKYLGDRLERVYEATNKGTHGKVSKEEADRYVLLTYLLMGDLLSLGY